jgi:hypothetical protein
MPLDWCEAAAARRQTRASRAARWRGWRAAHRQLREMAAAVGTGTGMSDKAWGSGDGLNAAAQPGQRRD